MKKTTYLLLILISMTFVSGAAIGFFAGRLTAPKRSRKHRKFSRSKEKMKAMFQQRICKRLKLTDEQKKSTQAIIDAWLDEMGKLRQQHAPQYLAVFSDFYAKIAPALTPKQKIELNKWKNRFTRKGGNDAEK